MQLLEKVNVRTRSRIRRGVAPKPDCAGKSMFNRSKDKGKVWSKSEYITHGFSEKEAEISRHLPMSADKIHPLLLLPSQQERHVELSAEQKLYNRLFFDTIEDLQSTFRPKTYRALGKRQEIFSWMEGDPATVDFDYVVNILDMDKEVVLKAIKFACNSWAETNGAIPDLNLSRSHTFAPTEAEEPKPPPVFVERFKPEDMIPRMQTNFQKKTTSLTSEAVSYIYGV